MPVQPQMQQMMPPIPTAYGMPMQQTGMYVSPFGSVPPPPVPTPIPQMSSQYTPYPVPETRYTQSYPQPYYAPQSRPDQYPSRHIQNKQPHHVQQQNRPQQNRNKY